MICPKCLSIESDGNLRCHKCGAQLHTGVFQRPAVELVEPRQTGQRWEANSLKRKLVAFWVFLLAVSALVLILSRLEAGLH